MRDRLMAETKAALKAQDKARLSALRLISAELQTRDIAAKTSIPDQDIPARAAEDDQAAARIARRSTSSTAARSRRQQEAGEIAVIEEFLPKQMSEAEAKTVIAAVVKEVGAASPKDMGKVMAVLKERYAGQMDFGKASGAGEGAAEVGLRESRASSFPRERSEQRESRNPRLIALLDSRCSASLGGNDGMRLPHLPVDIGAGIGAERDRSRERTANHICRVEHHVIRGPCAFRHPCSMRSAPGCPSARWCRARWR